MTVQVSPLITPLPETIDLGVKSWAERLMSEINMVLVPTIENQRQSVISSGYISLSDLSSTATGLTYTSATGIFSTTTGYGIPTTASASSWISAYGWGNHAAAGYYVGTSTTIKALFSSTATGLTYTSATGVISWSSGYVGTHNDFTDTYKGYLNQEVKTTSSPTFATPTVTGITIGANTLTTSEWAYLDGQDQVLKTTDGPTFDHVHITTPTASSAVKGPASATDNAVARFDSTTGGLLKNSVIVVDDSGNITGGSYAGAIEGKSVDLVQVSNLGIVDNDTDVFVFDFVPSKIILHFSGNAYRLTSGESGGTCGNTIITVTGTNTITSNMNNTSWFWDSYPTPNATIKTYVQNNTSNVIYAQAGRNAAGSGGEVQATAAWVTATKTLTITYDERNTITDSNFIEIVAVAYK